MRVLVAEDNAVIRGVIADVLRRCGHEVVQTASGTDAWEIMQGADAPALALLDWVMPGLHGPDVVRRIRALDKQGRSPYLVILTARKARSDIVDGLEAGADDYLTKPFDAGELRARVEVGRRVVELREAMAARVDELQRALDEVKTLRGILPICMYCKQIRDDGGFWRQVEAYVESRTEVEFSHGVCPACFEERFPEVARASEA